MKFWIDTEFFEDGRTIELISIGAVAEDGRTFYAETREAIELAKRSEWLRANVYPQLSARRKHSSRASLIAADLVVFMGDHPEIWACYGAYDWVCLCQLFGRMIDLPKTWPYYCRDVKQLADSLGNPTLPKQATPEHHALNDALWTRDAWKFLMAAKGAPGEKTR